MRKVITRFLIPLALVAGSLAAAGGIVFSAHPAEKVPPAVTAPLVDFTTVVSMPSPWVVMGSGVVEPSQVVTISPEVAGTIVAVGESVVLGGRLKKGDLVAKLNDRTYALAVRERRSQVEQAKVDLEIEQSRGHVAAREWDLLTGDRQREKNPLALREPQQEAAKVAVESARAALEQAKYNRTRAVLRAPFNATVVEESAEVGQYVGPGTPITKLYGTDAFWVRVQLRLEDLPALELPDAKGQGGSKAIIEVDLGRGQRLLREGRVIRLMTEVDQTSRTAQVLVEIKHPLDPKEAGEMPLLPGTFAQVRIMGRFQPSVVGVPRSALADGDKVWVLDDDDTLHRKSIDIGWQTGELLFVLSGVEAGQRVLTTDLPVLVEGMKVRTEAQAPTETQEEVKA